MLAWLLNLDFAGSVETPTPWTLPLDLRSYVADVVDETSYVTDNIDERSYVPDNVDRRSYV